MLEEGNHQELLKRKGLYYQMVGSAHCTNCDLQLTFESVKHKRYSLVLNHMKQFRYQDEINLHLIAVIKLGIYTA